MATEGDYSIDDQEVDVIESLPLAAAFTALFAVTGLFHLRRCAALWSAGPVAGQDRAVELGHLLMSVAMIGMTWAWGGPNAWWLQIAVFGVLTALFLARAGATPGGAARGLHTGRAAFGYHALAMGAMTWMVAAMPLLGHSIGAAGSGHHHDGAAATAAPATTSVGGTPLWAMGVTVVLAGALGVSAFVWAAVSARTPASAPVAVAAGAASAGAASAAVSAGAVSGAAAAGAPGAAAARALLAEPAHDRPAGWCHALMGVGMAAMLLVMV